MSYKHQFLYTSPKSEKFTLFMLIDLTLLFVISLNNRAPKCMEACNIHKYKEFKKKAIGIRLKEGNARASHSRIIGVTKKPYHSFHKIAIKLLI